MRQLTLIAGRLKSIRAMARPIILWPISKLFSFSEEEIAIMEAQNINLGISHMSRVYINFALGKAYEDKGLFEKSFEHYERGNPYKKAQSRYKS